MVTSLRSSFLLFLACNYHSHRRCLELIRRPCASRKVRTESYSQGIGANYHKPAVFAVIFQSNFVGYIGDITCTHQLLCLFERFVWNSVNVFPDNQWYYFPCFKKQHIPPEKMYFKKGVLPHLPLTSMNFNMNARFPAQRPRFSKFLSSLHQVSSSHQNFYFGFSVSPRVTLNTNSTV